MIDSHCHLAHCEGPPEAVVAEARSAGVVGIVDVGMGRAEAEAAAARAASLDGVWAAAGYHPNDLEAYAADPAGAMCALEGLLERPGVVAVGETGLDFYRKGTPPELQEHAFRAHAVLARERDLTLIVHCREAHARVLEILDEVGAPPRVVMHCFSGDTAYAAACAERHFFCSFAGNLTYRRNDELRRAAASLRGELLLVETDAPYLAPEPHRGRPNRPALLGETLRVLAATRGTSPAGFEPLLDANTRRAFALP